MTKSKSLSDRIQSALKGGKSEGMSALISEAEAAAKQSRAASGAARERALDPLLTDEQIAEARKDSEDAQFTADRMERAAKALGDALTIFLRAEDQERRREHHANVKARRDAIEAKFRERYPALSNELGALLAEIAAVERDMTVVNNAIPNGCEHLPPLQPWDRSFTSTINLPSIHPGAPMVWGLGISLTSGKEYHPHPNAEAACPDAASDRTDEQGVSVPFARSSVRLVPRDAEDAA